MQIGIRSALSWSFDTILHTTRAHEMLIALDVPLSTSIRRFAIDHAGNAAIIVGFVLVAFLVNRFVPRKRKHVRRTAILVLLYLVGLAASVVLYAIGSPWGAAVHNLSEFLAMLTVVHLVVLVLFDLGLPAIGVSIPTILTDLAIGAAYIGAALASLRAAGANLSTIVASTTVVGGIIAISMQNTLNNVIGGVALQLDGSIQPGDWIQLPDGRQGKVGEIRWRHTVVENRDWDTIIVPNSVLLTSQIIILGKREGEPLQHRMWVYFNVDFRHAPNDVIQVVEKALHGAAIEGVATTPAPNCVCLDFAREHRDSFAYYAVRYWLTDLARDDPASSRVRARVYAALKRAKIPLAIPGAHLWVEQDSSERRDRKERQDLNRRMEAIKSLGFLASLVDDERTTIAANLMHVPFAAGETITRQGDPARNLYIVDEGTAEVRVAVNGRDEVVASIKAPGFFGEMGLMTGEPRTATVIAATDVDCYRLDKESFQKIIADRPEIAAEISNLLAQRKVELMAAKEHLDQAARTRRIEVEKRKLLDTIQNFFGLDE